jgi:YD repeat-containing protein
MGAGRKRSSFAAEIRVIPALLVLISSALVCTQALAINTYAARWAWTAGMPTGPALQGYEEKSCLAAGDKSWQAIQAAFPNATFVSTNCANTSSGYMEWFPQGGALRQEFLFGYCNTPQIGNPVHVCPAVDPAPHKNRGPCPTCVGNPLQPGFGNKFQTELDYAGSGSFPLRLERAYNSALFAWFNPGSPMGANWTHSYQRNLNVSPNTTSPVMVSAFRPDGKMIAYCAVAACNATGSTWSADPDLVERLERTASGWKLTTAEDNVELYDADGRLLSIANRNGLSQTLSYYTTGAQAGLLQTVTDAFGRTLTFEYDAQNRLQTVRDPAGQPYQYGYSTSGSYHRLTSVTYPDGNTRTYHYESPLSALALTGITDELGVRFSTYDYQADGRAILSRLTGGEDVSIVYSGSSAIVTQKQSATLSTARTYAFQNFQGVPLLRTVTGPACPECGPKTTHYNAIGLSFSRIDWNNNNSQSAYDSRNLEFARSEAFTDTGQATADTIYIYRQLHPVFRLATVESEPLRRATLAYDPDGTQCGARGALCSKTVQATSDPDGALAWNSTLIGSPRTWAYTYNANGQVLTANGPRTDVADTATTTYYANNDADPGKRGNVATIMNALNQTTQITAYNAHGQPLTIIDPNGLTTTLAYDLRQRLTSRNVGGETTTYGYNAAGLLTKVTMPDGAFLSYSYDAAHRLTGIQDNLGNRIAYTLDLAGNRTKEELFDPLNALQQTKGRVYLTINRLFQELGALNQTTEYTYDPQGNVLTVKDPLNQTTTNTYTRRNQLKQATDPAKGVTQYTYNGLSALISVKDPRNLTTTYAPDGLGNLNTQVSPDTGTTANTYDLAGNLATQTDAKGQVTTYAYDALNRVSLITFHDKSTQAYAYDAGTNGLGRLTSITETNPSSVTTSVIAYQYDQHGRVISEARTIGGVTYTTGYSYTNGNLTGITYPSGRTLTYSLDSMSRVNQVTTATGGTPQVVVENVAYHPLGNAKSWNLGNGQTYARTIDQDGRIASYILGGTASTIGFDNASRITGITPNTYGYDSLDRLTSAKLPATSYGYSYDAVGNRLTKTIGAATDNYTYSATSNRISTLTPSGSATRNFTLDANGSTTSDALNTFVYDTRGRMVQATNAASLVTTYQVNAFGQRIRKTNSNEDTVFTYDTTGKLIAENAASGTLKREFIYLGDVPVGVVQAGSLAFIQSDHLNTPRLITDANQQAVWRNDNAEPFGNSPVDENPSGLGVFPFPLRESNYYDDKETNQRYAMFRDCYDTATGRFCQPDPVGVAGLAMASGQIPGIEDFAASWFATRPVAGTTHSSVVMSWPYVELPMVNDLPRWSGASLFSYVDSNPLRLTDFFGLNPGDKWYGFNDPNFRDYVHGVKQEMNLPKGFQFDKQEITNLHKCWEEEGRPRGKGGKSGKGGKQRDWKRFGGRGGFGGSNE